MNAPHHPLPPIQELRDRFHYDAVEGHLVYRKAFGRAPKGAVAGTLEDSGYIKVRINGVAFYRHRIVYFMVTGVDLGGTKITHRNGVLTDDRFSNLVVKQRK